MICFAKRDPDTQYYKDTVELLAKKIKERGWQFLTRDDLLNRFYNPVGFNRIIRNFEDKHNQTLEFEQIVQALQKAKSESEG